MTPVYNLSSTLLYITLFTLTPCLSFSPHYDIQFMRLPCFDRRCTHDVQLYITSSGLIMVGVMRWTILTYLSPVRGSIKVIRWSLMPYGNPDSLHKASSFHFGLQTRRKYSRHQLFFHNLYKLSLTQYSYLLNCD